MKQQHIYAMGLLCSVAVMMVSAAPMPANNQELDVLQIPLSNGKELDVLTLGAKDEEQMIADRNKRTIGLLRELFPDITKEIDLQINRLVNEVLRQVGPAVLGTALNPALNPTNGGGKNGAASDTQIDLSAINKQLEETIRVARQVKEAEAALQQQQQVPQQLPIPQSKHEETIQLSFNNEVSPLTSTNDNTKSLTNDLRLSESKSPALDELTLDSIEDTADLDDRNKRFLSFGGGGLAGGSSSSGSSSSAGGAASGGSGNFLFDIVRLFSGSVQTQTGDESANNGNSVSGSSDSDGDSDAQRTADGYTEAIPGPVTRLVVLANRGLANLIQDLILRVAATSEKFVNFKAKLITALI